MLKSRGAGKMSLFFDGSKFCFDGITANFSRSFIATIPKKPIIWELLRWTWNVGSLLGENFVWMALLGIFREIFKVYYILLTVLAAESLQWLPETLIATKPKKLHILGLLC